MGRRASRELAMKLLYQLEVQKEDRQEQIETALNEEEGLTDSDRKYVEDVVEGVYRNIAYLDETIEKYSKGWKINRMPKVDLNILRLAIYEISFREDIPFNVSVNEAVELAKKYSTKEAGSFINGILGKVPHVRVSRQEEIKAEVNKT
ncbi:MAG: transcription antitermination factor NusB [Clostridia bacterium]|nr:transcription antitermination factor NusB [Clostridia bacterium]